MPPRNCGSGSRETGLFQGLVPRAHLEGGRESRHRPEEREAQRGSREAIQVVPQVQSCSSSLTKTYVFSSFPDES